MTITAVHPPPQVEGVSPAGRATSERPAVRVSGLQKTYPGDVAAVRGISFEVARGEIFGLLGPNGAGKSTTIGVLTGLVRPTDGSASVAGFDTVRDALSVRRASAVVFQEPSLDLELSGLENLTLHARLWRVPGIEARATINALVEELDLAAFAERLVKTYSGGQRRRLEIARAMVSSPEVLILDEPTVGLDARIRHQLLDLIGRLRHERGLTVLLTTHYLEEAERLADRVAIMSAGRIVALDTPVRLLGSLGERMLDLQVERAPDEALRLLRDASIVGTEAISIGNTITAPAPGDVANELLAAVHALPIAVRAASVRPPSLDDVYLRLTGQSFASD